MAHTTLQDLMMLLRDLTSNQVFQQTTKSVHVKGMGCCSLSPPGLWTTRGGIGGVKSLDFRDVKT
jgi:hypothetical protein